MKEEEIRPQKIFDEFLRLSQKDIEEFFVDALTENGLCPACDNFGEFVFKKNGFEFQTCSKCNTLFVNPRPSAKNFAKYYQQSSAAKYWATTFYKETAEARKEKLWKPKAKMVLGAIQKFGAMDHRVIDIGGGYGLFASEMGDLIRQPVLIIEPNPHFAAVCRENSLLVLEKFMEEVDSSDLSGGPNAFTSFELFEHLHSPIEFLKHLYGLMESNDLFIFTTLSGTGLDIRVLWENSKSVFPPHHLNFLNPFSIKILLERVGLDLLEVTTPGKLDIDILSNNHDLIKDRFWSTFVAFASEPVKDNWQGLIADSGWSSHMMVICRKP